MSASRFALLVCILAAIGACRQQNAAEPDGDTVAVVNGVAIDRTALQAYQAQKQAAQPDRENNRKAALNEMIDRELIKQEALDSGIDEREDLQTEMEYYRTNLLVNTFVRERLQEMQFEEDELQQEYETRIEQLADEEYKARHILVETEEEAKAIIGRLEKGQDFSELAATESIDSSAAQGGDLGWFRPESMVPPFAEAVQSMEEGESSSTPIETQFGWHVIRLDETREVEPPPFEEVRDRLEALLANRALEDYLGELRAGADIEVREVGEGAE